MFCNELKELQDSAHGFLRSQTRPLPTPSIARHLFGAHRHEMPETQVVVRTLLGADPRFVETHDQSWTVCGSDSLCQSLDETTFAVVDLETTGSVIGVDEIIEIGIVVLRGGQIIQNFESLVWTDRRIPPWVARLTGISNDDLVGAPTFSDVSTTIRDMLDGCVFVAHDIRFDLPFLRWELARRGLARPSVTGLCTLILSRQLWPDLVSRSLPDLSEQFGIVHENPHRASADAAAAAGVLLKILEETQVMGLADLGDLYRIEDFMAINRSDDIEPPARAAES